MNVTKCDWCGTETQNAMDWLKLSRPWPDNDPKKGFVLLGREELDFCSEACVFEKMKEGFEKMKEQLKT